MATPQTIINGRVVTNGGNRANLIQSIRATDRGATGPEIEATGNRLIIGPGNAAKPATVWLIRFDSRMFDVPIQGGENGGKTLAHRNVVRSIEPLGAWAGAKIVLSMPAATNPAYRAAVLVQQGKGGSILAARAF